MYVFEKAISWQISLLNFFLLSKSKPSNCLFSHGATLALRIQTCFPLPAHAISLPIPVRDFHLSVCQRRRLPKEMNESPLSSSSIFQSRAETVESTNSKRGDAEKKHE